MLVVSSMIWLREEKVKTWDNAVHHTSRNASPAMLMVKVASPSIRTVNKQEPAPHEGLTNRLVSSANWEGVTKEKTCLNASTTWKTVATTANVYVLFPPKKAIKAIDKRKTRESISIAIAHHTVGWGGEGRERPRKKREETPRNQFLNERPKRKRSTNCDNRRKTKPKPRSVTKIRQVESWVLHLRTKQILTLFLLSERADYGDQAQYLAEAGRVKARKLHKDIHKRKGCIRTLLWRSFVLEDTVIQKGWWIFLGLLSSWRPGSTLCTLPESFLELCFFTDLALTSAMCK